MAYLDPFRQYGLNAGASLQEALYSPSQRAQQIETQRAQLQGEVDRLKDLAPKWETYQILTGKNASERWASLFTAELDTSNRRIAEAQAKLKTFEQQAAAQPAGGQGPQIQASPWYQFQVDLLNRSQDRAFAARGLTCSGFEAEERRRGLIELGAGETERQFGRLKGLYDVGAQAAGAGAGAITGTSQAIANQQIGAGQAQAQGLIGVAGANKDMAYGIANSINGAAGTYLMQTQWDKFRADLNSRNSGYDPVMGIGKPPGTMADATARNTASLDYLQPVP